MATEIKLGLCNPPEPIYLYVNQGEVDGESYVWYKFNISQEKKTPVTQRALTGYLSELRLTAKEFKGKDNLKLDIVISADELYIIRTGVETNFAKSFLLAASLVQDFSKPLIIAANPGDENTVFCNLHDGATKTKIKREWDKDADWATIIRDIQSLLGTTSNSIPSSQNPPKLSVVPQPVHHQDFRVKNIRILLDYPLDLVKEWLEFQNVDRPSLLDISKIDELIKTMCLAWAADKCKSPNHAESSYHNQVIDSESVADPSHAAFGCIAHLNEILTQYDLVIASPSLETGVSIDIKGHFDAVWGIFQGVQPVNSVRQMLARLRETVDRHIWVREWGMSVVGNGSTTIGGLLRSQHVATQANIALLSAADNDDYSYVDQNFQPESLQTWGKRGSVINAEMRCYRESVLGGLVEDGYTIIDAEAADDDETGAVIESVKAASEELYAGECQAIADSPTISDAELKKLQDKRAKTKTERHQQRKAELSRRYEIDVTPDLVGKDDDGWYPQLRMHYYLTLGREFLTKRDAKRAKAQLEAGENSIWKPDFNKGQLLPGVLLLENLNLLQFLTPGVQLRGSDERMLEFKALAVQHRHIIKNYLNVSISEKLTPVAIAQKLLDKIDLKLDYVGRLGSRENRECVYQFVAPDDERDSIFGQWLSRDEVFLSESVSVNNNTALSEVMRYTN